MFWFIIAVLFAIVTLLMLIFGPRSYKVLESDSDYNNRVGYNRNADPERKVLQVLHPKRWALVPLFITVFFLALSMLASVGTHNVGVETSFGKPTGQVYDAGLNWKSAPWDSVHDIDATIHFEQYYTNPTTGEGNGIQVKIADGGNATIGLSYRWRINPDAASQVYQDYRNSNKDLEDAVQDALVSTNIKAAINEVLGTYDPLSGADITADMTPQELANLKINVVPDYQLFNDEIEKNVAAKLGNLGGLVDIQSVTISSLQLPEATQKKINAFNQAAQDTKIAIQQIATKNAQADGNRALASSLADPNVLVAQCFNSIANGEFTPPAGFSCWPGNNGSVVIPSAK